MTAIRRSGGVGLSAVRWTARISALLLFGLVFAFLVGEGPPNPLTATAVENVQFAAFAVLWFGLAAGWWREGLGAAMVLGGLGAFYVINYAASGSFPGGLFPAFAVPGVLFLICAAGSRVTGGPEPERAGVCGPRAGEPREDGR